MFRLSMLCLLLMGGVALAESPNDAPSTPATEIHGLPANNPGFGGSSANPEGGGVNGGNGIHDIGDNPGQSGYNPAQSGIDPAQSMHGGLNATTGRDPSKFDSER